MKIFSAILFIAGALAVSAFVLVSGSVWPAVEAVLIIGGLIFGTTLIAERQKELSNGKITS